MEKAEYKARMKKLRGECSRLKTILKNRERTLAGMKEKPLIEIFDELLDSIAKECKIKNTEYCDNCAASRDEAKFNGPNSTKCSECVRAVKLESSRVCRTRESYKARRNAKLKHRMKTDPMFLLTKRIRGRISGFIRTKGFVRLKNTQDMLGCSFEHLKAHIERQFRDGMGWHNMGDWHIDHKKPLASAKNEQELIDLNHYTNLRPMWAIDNLKKGSRYNGVTY